MTSRCALGTEGAGGYTLFDAGDAQPLGRRAHHRRSAEGERVAVGVGLDDGQQLAWGAARV
jgi:hypothetical protein